MIRVHRVCSRRRHWRDERLVVQHVTSVSTPNGNGESLWASTYAVVVPPSSSENAQDRQTCVWLKAMTDARAPQHDKDTLLATFKFDIAKNGTTTKRTTTTTTTVNRERLRTQHRISSHTFPYTIHVQRRDRVWYMHACFVTRSGGACTGGASTKPTPHGYLHLCDDS